MFFNPNWARLPVYLVLLAIGTVICRSWKIPAAIFGLWLVRMIRSEIRMNIRGRSVVITGCDYGFGFNTARMLAKKGVRVYAGCYTKEGIEKLKTEGDCLRPHALDVRDESSIQKFASFVQSECPDGIYALVNNAGIVGCQAEVDLSQMAYYRDVMEVNFFGLVACTRAFYPMVKKQKGRIVNMASAAGRIPLHGISQYCATKHAVEAFSDCLRLESRDWGVSVITFEPGFMKTPILDQLITLFNKVWDNAPAEMKAQYGEEYWKTKVGLYLEVAKNSADPQQF